MVGGEREEGGGGIEQQDIGRLSGLFVTVHYKQTGAALVCIKRSRALTPISLKGQSLTFVFSSSQA